MYIHVKVKTKSKEESFIKIKENYYEIRVREEAKNNLANKKVIELVRKNIDDALPAGRQVKEVKIINGHHSPSKLISVTI